MTELEQRLLSVIQDAFPLEKRPYQVLAGRLGSDEQSTFAAVESLRKSGVIRRIGGVYDSRRLGFVSRLCAGKVADIDRFAATVNEISAITHNYVRSHEYNVWFTVIAQSEGEIHAIVDGLCANTDLRDVHVLSATKKLKINTVMGTAALKTESSMRVEKTESAASGAWRKQSPVCVLSGLDRARISLACTDIPHTLTPFKDWGVSTEELRDDLAQKRMRRFGAILRHQDAGFAYNAMVCFATHADAGTVLAQKPYISHCYERPVFEGFPYNLYAMMHAQSAAELDQYIKDAAASIGNPEYAVLNSMRELKKTSFRFFE